MATVAHAPSLEAVSEHPTSECNVCRLHEDDALRLTGSWNRLAGDTPFHRWQWLVTWWKHFRAPSDELFVLAVRDGTGSLVGLAPWYLATTFGAGRRVRFLGSGTACSEYMSLLCLPGWEREVARAIAAWLNDPRAGDKWDGIVLDSVDPEDHAIRELILSLCQLGHRVHQTPGADTWHVALPDCWEEYLASLTSHRRRRLRRICRRGLDNGRAVFHPIGSGHDLDQGLDLLCRLSCDRRAGSDEPSTLACPKFVAFLREAVHGLQASGHLRFGTLKIDDRPAAVVCAFIGDGSYYGYQMALDPSAAHDEPGWLLLISEMQSAISDGLHTFDFLRGAEHYKTHWRAKPRPQIDIRIAARSLRGDACHGVWLAKQRSRAGLKTWLQRMGLRKQQPVAWPQRVRGSMS